MPNTKRLTDEIREDMRKRYEAGEATQAELADLFNFSIPSVNKAVKGIKPAKRKYKVSDKKLERNAAIVAAYNPDEGVGMEQLAEQFNMTYQNVSLILKAAGVNPRNEHFKRVRVKAAERQKQVAAQKQAKKQAKAAKVEELSTLWLGGCSIEEFRAAAGVKSPNAAQVKLVHLRKTYGEEKFPRRSNRSTMTAEEKKEKAQELSRIYQEDPKNREAQAAVFGDDQNTVQRRICALRNEFGEELFPRIRQPKKAAPEVEEVEEIGLNEGEMNEVIEDTLEFVTE